MLRLLCHAKTESGGGEEVKNSAREIFHSVKEAKVLVENWRLGYNNHRPHSGLGYKTPAAFAAGCIVSAPATPSPQQYMEQNVSNSLITCGT